MAVVVGVLTPHLAVLTAAALFFRGHAAARNEEWDKLRAAATAGQPPPAFRRIAVYEEGPGGCGVVVPGFDTCTAQSIVSIYETPYVEVDQMCEALRPSVRRMAGSEPDSTRPSGGNECLYAPLPGVGERAFVSVSASGSCSVVQRPPGSCVRIAVQSAL